MCIRDRPPPMRPPPSARAPLAAGPAENVEGGADEEAALLWLASRLRTIADVAEDGGVPWRQAVQMVQDVVGEIVPAPSAAPPAGPAAPPRGPAPLGRADATGAGGQ
eukprot:9118482-Pyramimonas_sp.AAC.1